MRRVRLISFRSKHFGSKAPLIQTSMRACSSCFGFLIADGWELEIPAPVIVMLGALCVGSSSASDQTPAASRRGDICNMRALA